MSGEAWPAPEEFWRSRRVMVTGGAGFLGSFVVEELRRRGGADVVVPRSKEYDLRDTNAVRPKSSDGRGGGSLLVKGMDV